MKTVYFMRHGQSQANLDHVYAGQLDVALTDEGLRQAAAAAQEALPLGIQRVYCSDLQRSEATAQIVAAELGLHPIIDPRLREINLGKLQGTPEDGFAHYVDYSKREGNPMEVELQAAVRSRLQSFIDELTGVDADAILIVGHNASGVILRALLDHTISDLASLPKLPNAHIIKVGEL